MLPCVCASHTVMSNPGNPWTGALSGSFVHRILQARILECFTLSSRQSSNARVQTVFLGCRQIPLPFEPLRNLNYYYSTVQKVRVKTSTSNTWMKNETENRRNQKKLSEKEKVCNTVFYTDNLHFLHAGKMGTGLKNEKMDNQVKEWLCCQYFPQLAWSVSLSVSF